MKTVQFDTLFDLLACEMDLPVADLKRAAQEEAGAEALPERASQALAAQPVDYVLAEPLNDQAGHTLLQAGMKLRDKISQIVARQAKNPEVALGPVILKATESLVGAYQKRISDRVMPLIEAEYEAEDQIVKRITSSIKPAVLERMKVILRTAVGELADNDRGLMVMVQATREPHTEPLWRGAIKVGYVGMAIADSIHELASEEERDLRMTKVGKAAMLGDIAVMLKASLYRNDLHRHPVRSVQILREMGLDEEVLEIVANHHRFLKTVEDDEEDTGEVDAATISEESRILCVANLFISALTSATARANDIQTIKGLNFLMADGKLERRAVSALTKLYLSRKFALFVEKATEIMNLCPHEYAADPILWNILGERTPQKFICTYRDCAHLGSQTTKIATNIPVVFEGKTISKIKKGDYNNCRYLTSELERLYKKIASLGT